MKFKAVKVKLKEILPFRALFLQESNFQIRYNACHERGWSDSYLLSCDGLAIGYGSIKGKVELKDRDAVFEWYVMPPYRRRSSLIFPQLLSASGAAYVECQSNDLLLSSLLFEFSANINADYALFKDHSLTELSIPEVVFRHRRNGDPDDVGGGDYLLLLRGEIVATGGFLLHYNKPFADLYMEVHKDHRRQGFGSFIVQEVKKECYLAGRVPAARSQVVNKASKSTLVKAGLRVAGFMLTGSVKTG